MQRQFCRANEKAIITFSVLVVANSKQGFARYIWMDTEPAPEIGNDVYSVVICSSDDEATEEI